MKISFNLLIRIVCQILLVSVLANVNAYSQLSMTIHHNDLNRTGANLSETVLNASNVNQTTFGRLWSYPVGGHVYAQPLVVSGVNIPGHGTKNVVYIVDMHNSIFAYDADDPAQANTPYWRVDYGKSVALPDPNIALPNYNDIHVEIGIMSTPAIDVNTNTIYFVTKTKTGSVYADSLHALDLSTGLPKFGGSQIVSKTIPGTGEGGSTITFKSNKQNQRCALTLSNGIVYLTYASYGDALPYHGWIFGYSANNINNQAISYCLNPNTVYDGIWMSGEGLSVDASGNLYGVVGTGDPGAGGFGESFLKYSPNLGTGTLDLVDFFTPYNKDSLDAADADLGSSGLLMIPGSNVMTSAGKAGVLYVLDQNNLGQFHSGTNPSADQVLQEWKAFFDFLMMTGVFWGDSASNPNTGLAYFWASNESLRAYRFNYLTNRFNTTPWAMASTSNKPERPGAMMSLSANGHTAGSGVLWASFPKGPAIVQTVSGNLRAFNANNLTEIWNSAQVPNRDSVGNFAKFVPPTVINGKVYLATFSGLVHVYGLLSSLPVVYTDFNAVRVNNSVHLTWVTNFEQNNDHYEVLRSTNGRDFTKIGEVQSKGNSNSEQDYFFDDNTPVNGTNFYRLRQVDIDGKFHLSNIITINIDLIKNIYFQIYPNPGHSNITVACNGLNVGDQVFLEMYNSGGSLVYKKQAVIDANAKVSIARSSSMVGGVYYMRFTLPSGQTMQERFIWGY
ncbi:MAG: hypothetical protein C5B52_12415 [Bacteroidetes bacterium]|nr:MAG: hypothetical protein C5B52_12415 [Bacteroidota bacterium]